MRSTLVGSLVEVLRVNLARKASRVRVFELGKVFLRDPALADGPLGGRRRSPAAQARRPRVRPGRAGRNGASPSGRSTSSTSRATSRRCCTGRGALRPGAASGAASRAQRRDRARRRAHRLHRRAASALAPGVRAAGSGDRVRDRRRGADGAAAADLRPAAEAAVGVARHRHRRPARRHASSADDGARCRRPRASCATRRCSTSTSRKARAPASTKASAAWRSGSSCATTTRTLTDEQIERVVAGVVAALERGVGARAEKVAARRDHGPPRHARPSAA